MNILLAYRRDTDKKGNDIPTYSTCFRYYLEKFGHNVTPVGIGHPLKHIEEISDLVLKTHDLFIDIDCGRNKDGNLHLQLQNKTTSIPSAVWFIDSHGHPTLHHRMSQNYNFVFFAVWRRRDLFTKHSHSYWLPNSSDTRWFNYLHHLDIYRNPEYTIGFFGSKGGLDRADIVRDVVAHHSNYSADIRQIGGQRWPHTAEAMANCKILFNKGQKHDGPNQRVMESMLMCRPLLNDRDPEDGMEKLFKEGTHYLGWKDKSELGEQIRWCLTNQDLANSMAVRAFHEVSLNHQISNRVKTVIDICQSRI